MKFRIVLAVALIAVAAIAYYNLRMPNHDTMPMTAAASGAPMVEVKLPVLTGNEILGETAFNAKCASCHGTNAAGKEGDGPPLIHKIYEPSHHGDFAIQRAIENGASGHHWPFGKMDPVEGLTQGDIKNIIEYIRALQRENGIQ